MKSYSRYSTEIFLLSVVEERKPRIHYYIYRLGNTINKSDNNNNDNNVNK